MHLLVGMCISRIRILLLTPRDVVFVPVLRFTSVLYLVQIKIESKVTRHTAINIGATNKTIKN